MDYLVGAIIIGMALFTLVLWSVGNLIRKIKEIFDNSRS